MRKQFAICALLILATASTGFAGDVEARRQEIMDRIEVLKANEEDLSESDRLSEFIDVYFDYVMHEHPEFGTYIGLPGGHDRWTDNSLAAEARRDQDTIDGLAALRNIDRATLEGEDKLNYDLLIEDMELEIAAQRFDGEYLAISQMSGVHQNTARMMAMMPGRKVGDFENILARLEGVPYRVDMDLEKLKMGLEAGVTPPKVTIRNLPDQVENQIFEEALDSPMLRAFKNFPESISAEEQERLRGAAVSVYSEKIVPSFEKLHAFLVESYLPGARESIGMKDLPNGEEWYALRVREMTTTDLSPKEIHEIGLSEVARIRAEMDRVIEESGFEGSFEEFTEFLRTDPRFYFEEAEDLLSTYRDIAKRADAELPKLFGRLPMTPYGITPVPEESAKSQTTAYYEPGSLDAGRAGQFFANTYDLKSRPSWEMEALTLHEAVPGHHLQIALSHERDELPWFRRFGGYTAYIEGWGLYSESLGEDMGFYKDPYSKFGQLTYEMWRAIRLVVDTGMHSLGWSRQDAIDFFKENTGKAEHDIVVEVDRYIVWPGQALAYKIGELKIKELRAQAEQELGDDFDVRAFHDRLLGNGALPLSVLETHMNEWVSAQKEGASDAASGAVGR